MLRLRRNRLRRQSQSSSRLPETRSGLAWSLRWRGPTFFRSLLKHQAQALYVIGDHLLHSNRLRTNAFALANYLPTMLPQREFVEAVGLMSYGANFPDSNRRAAEFVDKILRGAKPADLPVEQPTKFDLIINQIVAKALRIEMPANILARADEVIE
jgi:putative tryptophan/tyrosine transport system substrate-binding protein